MMYYEEGNPRLKSISPDIFVAFGIGRKERRIYKIWEEGKPPDFVLEFASNVSVKPRTPLTMDVLGSITLKTFTSSDVIRSLPTSVSKVHLLMDVFTRRKRVAYQSTLDAISDVETLRGKVQLYAEIGIPEYFVYDVDRRYLPTPLMGFRLMGKSFLSYMFSLHITLGHSPYYV